MSLANIKAKQAKGKQKTLPKLKTILTNPFKTKCPSVDENEMRHLTDIFREAITSSSMEPRAFVTSKRIRLGLESSLRAINNCQCSCVFLSHSIKPRHVVSLIARNVEVKDKTVPVYVQPRLEKFTEDLFGIGALALVLPTFSELKKFELDDIMKWVDQKRKQRIPAINVKDKQTAIRGKKKVQIKLEGTQSNNETNFPITPDVIKQETSSNSDFISFSNVKHHVELETLEREDDKDRLLCALSKMTAAAKKLQTTESIAQIEMKKVRPSINCCSTAVEDTLSLDSDDFLEECQYQPLVVHKINPNPGKQKKKRKKNKNKKN